MSIQEKYALTDEGLRNVKLGAVWTAASNLVVFGGVGLLLALVTLLVWRKMEGRAPVHFSGKAVVTVLVGIAGALALGVGMCFCMVWEQMILGICIGLAGIVILLCLIPLTKGIHA